MDRVEIKMNSYKRHGGKRYRAKQCNRIRAVLQHAKVGCITQLGSKHVIRFYEHLRAENMTFKTQMAYFYAIASAYKEIGRPKEPPRPIFTPTEMKHEKKGTEV